MTRRKRRPDRRKREIDAKLPSIGRDGALHRRPQRIGGDARQRHHR